MGGGLQEQVSSKGNQWFEELRRQILFKHPKPSKNRIDCWF